MLNLWQNAIFVIMSLLKKGEESKRFKIKISIFWILRLKPQYDDLFEFLWIFLDCHARLCLARNDGNFLNFFVNLKCSFRLWILRLDKVKAQNDEKF